MEELQKEKIQNLTNITYSMITSLTSIENSLNNISVILGRGGLPRAYQQSSLSGQSEAPAPEKDTGTQKKTGTVSFNETSHYINEEDYTSPIEASEETGKRRTEDLKKEMEKLSSMTLIPPIKGANYDTDEIRLSGVAQETFKSQSSINPNLAKELGRLEGQFGQKISKIGKAEQKGPAEQPMMETQASPSANPIEALMALVKERQSISISEAAKTLNFDASLIETWAKLLNDNNKIKLEYKIIGNPILKAK